MSVMIYIHDVLLKRLNPKAIFYLAGDEISEYREFGGILDLHLKAKEEWKIKTAYILLDEITFVEDWWRAIKSRIDLGKFKRDVIYISGSANIEVLKQKEDFLEEWDMEKTYIIYQWTLLNMLHSSPNRSRDCIVKRERKMGAETWSFKRI